MVNIAGGDGGDSGETGLGLSQNSGEDVVADDHGGGRSEGARVEVDGVLWLRGW